MKLPIVDRLQVNLKPYEMLPLLVAPHTSVAATTEKPSSPRYAHRYEVVAKFGIEQWSESGEPGAIIEMRNRAIRVLLREIYGPVEERLHEILVMLYEAPPVYDDKVLLAVNELLKDLRP